MADDASLQPPTPEHPPELREEDGVQWVALPSGERFAQDEVVVRQDRWGVTIQAKHKPPRRTPEQRKAFWAELDAMRGDDLLEAPPREPWPEPERGW